MLVSDFQGRLKVYYRKFIPYQFRNYVFLLRLRLKNPREYNRRKNWRQYKKRFGNANPDKKFFIIRKNNEAMGLLSCYLTFLGKLQFAEENNFIPIIDMKSVYYPLLHNSPKDVLKVNAWELFFEPVSSFALEDAYQSRNVLISSGFTSDNAMELFNETPITSKVIAEWIKIDKKYMRLRSDLMEQFENEYINIIGNRRTIGVMIREGYSKFDELKMKSIKGHPRQPSIEKTIQDLDIFMRNWNCDYIFLSTESLQTLDAFIRAFNGTLLYTKRKRRDISGDYSLFLKNSNEYANSQTAFHRNIEYLKEIYFLSKCTCLCCGKASGTVVAAIWNANRYEHMHFYDLGVY